MGCGRVGSHLANSLDAEGHDITILDIDAYSFDRFLSPEFHGTALLGSGTDEDVLRRAEIEKADAFIAVAHGDNRNVMACQIAKHVFRVPKVICRIYDPQRHDLYILLGIDAVSPTTLVAQALRDKLGA